MRHHEDEDTHYDQNDGRGIAVYLLGIFWCVIYIAWRLLEAL